MLLAQAYSLLVSPNQNPR